MRRCTGLRSRHAHQAGVRERHARAHFACEPTLADFCKVCTIKLSHARGSLHRDAPALFCIWPSGRSDPHLTGDPNRRIRQMEAESFHIVQAVVHVKVGLGIAAEISLVNPVQQEDFPNAAFLLQHTCFYRITQRHPPTNRQNELVIPNVIGKLTHLGWIRLRTHARNLHCRILRHRGFRQHCSVAKAATMPYLRDQLRCNLTANGVRDCIY